MVSIQLKRSGGQLGKTLQASREIDMEEEAIIKKLKSLAPPGNPQSRDELYYSITVNNKKSYPLDMALLKGTLKKIVSDLEEELKAEED